MTAPDMPFHDDPGSWLARPRSSSRAELAAAAPVGTGRAIARAEGGFMLIVGFRT